MPTARAPWLMLFLRMVLFFGGQTLFALGFRSAGSANAWEAGANWWPIVVALADLICLGFLLRVFRSEGKRYWDIFRIDRQNVKGDLLALLGLTVLTAPITYLPNVWLGKALFGNPDATLNLFVRPLPLWAAWIAILIFPVMQGLTELGTYFGYSMPRLEKQGVQKWLAISLPAMMLGFQHIAMPFLMDGRFIAWRAFMYIPFAFLTGMAFYWRPRLLPYFVVIHVLMNLSFATMFLSVAY